MKYLSKTPFSVGGGGGKYSENWERTFGKKKEVEELMTKDEFDDMIADLRNAAHTDGSDLLSTINEMREDSVSVASHDPTLSTHILAVVTEMENLLVYIRSLE